MEYDDEVIHVIAHHMEDATHQLYRLSDDMLNAPVARADHVTSPLPDKFNPRDNLREGAADPYRPVEPWRTAAGQSRVRVVRSEFGRTSARRPHHSPSRDFH